MTHLNDFHRMILIADDDESHRETMRNIFEPRGYGTILASDGHEAIALVEIHRIDCLLLDMHMPGLSGIETLRIVRRQSLIIPCVMITADVSRELIEQARSLNAFSVLSKPVNLDQITDAVRNAVTGGFPAA